jgi:hypothetical protein
MRNRPGNLTAYRYALAVARELRSRPGVAVAIREGVTQLDKQLARLEPNKMSIAESRLLYFSFINRAARIRRRMLNELQYPWAFVGYTAGAGFPGHVYVAPAGEPAPWMRGELQPWER